MVRGRLRSQRGMTLIELLIALFVGILVFLALYGLVDTSNKLTKQQTQVADVQQSARIGVSELSRIIRQSRVGGLSFANAVLPIANNGALLANADLVSYSGIPMTDLSGTSHSIRPGTDVIEVRGVLFGDKYILDEGDAICSGSCDVTTEITVTIPWKAALGFVNFPNGGSPSLADKTGSFYFVVQNGENQQITVGGQTYLLPIYVAGLVNATGGKCTLSNTTWCTLTTSSFSFKMNPQDAGAQKLNATICGGHPCATSLGKSVGGGPVDVVRFFVDDRGDTHPSLAEAIWDPSVGRWDVQTLIEEVEDFQIAYGVDGIDGTIHDGGVSAATVDESGGNKDEWVGNVAGEVTGSLPISVPDANHGGVDAFVDTTAPLAAQAPANPALRSVWISLVVKSPDPDLVYNGPGARGIKILDSTATSFSASTGRPYRRRPLSLAVSLRNNAFFNK
jgi:prepilin-type N-terminal cleavage/methylation domain-containing protein